MDQNVANTIGTNMRNILILILSFSLAFSSFGGCGQPVTHLNAGQNSPCDGFLFTPDKEQEVRTKTQQYDLLQQEDELKDKQIQLYKNNADMYNQIIQQEQQKSELWRKAAEDSTQKLMAADSNRGFKDFLLIGVGVILTCAGAWAVRQVR